MADERRSSLCWENVLIKLIENSATDATISNIFKDRDEYVEKAKPPTQIQSIKASGLL